MRIQSCSSLVVQVVYEHFGNWFIIFQYDVSGYTFINSIAEKFRYNIPHSFVINHIMDIVECFILDIDMMDICMIELKNNDWFVIGIHKLHACHIDTCYIIIRC